MRALQAPCESLARLGTARPWWTLAAAVVVVSLSLLSLRRLEISASLDTMLGLSSPAAQALHRVATEYQAGDGLFIIVDTPPGSEPDIGALTDLAQRLCGELVTDPGTGPLIRGAHYRADPALAKYARQVILPAAPYYLGPEGARELVSRFEAERLSAQFARNEALIASPGPAGSALSNAVLRDPLRLAELVPGGAGASLGSPGSDGSQPEVSIDGRAVLIRVAPSFPSSDIESAGLLYSGARAIIDRLGPNAQGVRLGGPSAIAAVSSRTIRADAIVSTSVSVLLLYLLFVVFHRRWVAPVLIGVTAGVGMLAGFGVFALFSRTISPLAAAVGALLAGLGVDYGIHFVSHFDNLRAGGAGPQQGAVATARHMALPIVTNCMTSIFGFASLWPSPMPMLSDFALLSAAGLLGSLLGAFTLLPALLVLTHHRGETGRPPRFGFVADLIAGRPRHVMLSSIAVLAIAVAAAGSRGFIPRLEGDLTLLHPRPNPALTATDEAVARFAGQGEIIPVLVRAATPEALLVSAIDAAGALKSAECRRAGVTSVLGLHQLVPDPRATERVNAELALVDPAQALDRFDRAVAESAFEPSAYADYRTFLHGLLTQRQPPGLAAVIEHPSIAARLFPRDRSTVTLALPTETVLLVRLSSPVRGREERARVVGTLRSALSGHPGVNLAGLLAVSDELEDATRRGLPQSILISVALVLVWLTLVFRRVGEVALSLTPLLIGAVGTLAFILAAGQRLNPINCIAIPLLDGIAVDAGVFLVSAARSGVLRSELVHRLRPTIHAVLLAIATTITGFAALCFTHTPAIRSLGLIAAVGITFAGVGAIGILVPLLLARATPSKPPARAPEGDR